MALPPAGAVIRSRFLFNTGNPQYIGFRAFWSYTGGPPTTANLVTLASNLDIQFAANGAAQMSTGLQLVQIICDDLSSSSGASGAWAGATPGTRTGSIPTDSTAMIMDLNIARRYRGGKPKMFLPFGVTTDLTNPNQWTTSFQNGCQTSWTNFATAVIALSGIGCTLTNQVNVSYFSGSMPNPNPSKWARKNVPSPRATPHIDVVVGYRPRPTPGVQRRRRGTS